MISLRVIVAAILVWAFSSAAYAEKEPTKLFADQTPIEITITGPMKALIAGMKEAEPEVLDGRLVV